MLWLCAPVCAEPWTPDLTTTKGTISVVRSALVRHSNMLGATFKYRRSLIETLGPALEITEMLGDDAASLEIGESRRLTSDYTPGGQSQFDEAAIAKVKAELQGDLRSLATKSLTNLSADFKKVKGAVDAATKDPKGKDKGKLYRAEAARLFRLLPFLYDGDGRSKYRAFGEKEIQEIVSAIQSATPSELEDLYFDQVKQHNQVQMNALFKDRRHASIADVFQSVQANFYNQKLKPSLKARYVAQAGLAQQTVSLESVPPLIALMRGCFGSDCSIISVPNYSLIKGTRVYWIRTQPGFDSSPEGYVFVAEVEHEGRTLPYLVTVNGLTLTPDAVKEVTRLVAKDFKTTEVIVPNFDEHPHLVNTSEVKAGLKYPEMKTVTVTMPSGWKEVAQRTDRDKTGYSNFYSGIEEARLVRLPSEAAESRLVETSVQAYTHQTNEKMPLLARSLLAFELGASESFFKTSEGLKSLAVTPNQVAAAGSIAEISFEDPLTAKVYRNARKVLKAGAEIFMQQDPRVAARSLASLYHQSPDLFSEGEWASMTRELSGKLEWLKDIHKADSEESKRILMASLALPQPFNSAAKNYMREHLTGRPAEDARFLHGLLEEDPLARELVLAHINPESPLTRASFLALLEPSKIDGINAKKLRLAWKITPKQVEAAGPVVHRGQYYHSFRAKEFRKARALFGAEMDFIFSGESREAAETLVNLHEEDPSLLKPSEWRRLGTTFVRQVAAKVLASPAPESPDPSELLKEIASLPESITKAGTDFFRETLTGSLPEATKLRVMGVTSGVDLGRPEIMEMLLHYAKRTTSPEPKFLSLRIFFANLKRWKVPKDIVEEAKLEALRAGPPPREHIGDYRTTYTEAIFESFSAMDIGDPAFRELFYSNLRRGRWPEELVNVMHRGDAPDLKSQRRLARLLPGLPHEQRSSLRKLLIEWNPKDPVVLYSLAKEVGHNNGSEQNFWRDKHASNFIGGLIGSGPLKETAITLLVRAMEKTQDPAVVMAGIEILSEQAPHREETTQWVLRGLTYPNSEVRDEAASHLGIVEVRDPKVADALRAAASGGEEVRSLGAATVLWENLRKRIYKPLTPADFDTLKVFVGFLGEEGWRTNWVRKVFSDLLPREISVQVLTEVGAQTDNPSLQSGILEVLGKLGPAHAVTLSLMRLQMGRAEAFIRHDLALHLLTTSDISSGEVRDLFLRALAAKEGGDRRAALELLASVNASRRRLAPSEDNASLYTKLVELMHSSEEGEASHVKAAFEALIDSKSGKLSGPELEFLQSRLLSGHTEHVDRPHGAEVFQLLIKLAPGSHAVHDALANEILSENSDVSFDAVLETMRLASLPLKALSPRLLEALVLAVSPHHHSGTEARRFLLATRAPFFRGESADDKEARLQAVLAIEGRVTDGDPKKEWMNLLYQLAPNDPRVREVFARAKSSGGELEAHGENLYQWARAHNGETLGENPTFGMRCARRWARLIGKRGELARGDR